jgi:hypothetical protein
MWSDFSATLMREFKGIVTVSSHQGIFLLDKEKLCSAFFAEWHSILYFIVKPGELLPSAPWDAGQYWRNSSGKYTRTVATTMTVL